MQAEYVADADLLRGEEEIYQEHRVHPGDNRVDLAQSIGINLDPDGTLLLGCLRDCAHEDGLDPLLFE